MHVNFLSMRCYVEIMITQMFTVGKLYTNCYIVSCEQTRDAVIVDPGFDHEGEAKKVLKFIEDNQLNVRCIINTHGHPDHTCGNGIAKEKFNVPILIHRFDAHMLGESSKAISRFLGFENFSPPADKFLNEGDLVVFGKVALRVIHTPGHSRGSISLLGGEEVFTGDTLFMGSIGRTDFPESSEHDMKNSLKKLMLLPENFVIYPGHGPESTIKDEKRSNPFVREVIGNI